MKAIRIGTNLLTIGSRWSIVLFLLWGWGNAARATHIVGAELTYECANVASNTYNVVLRMFRDCDDGEAEFDDPIFIFAFSEAVPGSYLIFDADLPPSTPEIIPEEWDDCVGRPYNLCVEEAVYRRQISLPPQNGGWQLAWARCCRNAAIDNLVNPLDLGVTFLARIPSPQEATCNSMPTFNTRLPVFICANETLAFDHSATDADSDSLVYGLTHPYDGLNFQGFGAGNANFGSPNPVVSAANPMGPPPYNLVNFAPGFNSQDAFGPNSVTINPGSGWLTVNAPNPGVYVVAISVFEYRDGILISENKRDLQVHVIDCLPQNDPPQISSDLTGLQTIGDTILVQATTDFCYRVTVTDTNQNPLSVTPISAIFSGGGSPTINQVTNLPGLLELDVCWDPGCDFSGAEVELILMGVDENNCPIYNPVFDTVYVEVLPPPNVSPDVDYDLTPVPSNGDTIIAEFDSAFCFNWWVVAPPGYVGTLSSGITISDLTGGDPFVPTAVTATPFNDSLLIEVCWTAGCDNLERIYKLLLQGTADNNCPPFNVAFDSLFIRIPPIINPPPVVTSDLSGNVFDQDTILIDIHEQACYQVTIDDTFPSAGLDYTIRVLDLNNQLAPGPAPQVTVLNTTDSLVVEVCWTPNCDNVDRTFALVLEGIQDNNCNQTASNFDTTYIHVNNVFNPPPIIGHTFRPEYEVSGDTIIIAVDSAACFDFFLRDTVVASFLSVEAEADLIPSGEMLDGAIDVTLNTNLDTLLEGTVCFAPGCDYLDELFQITLIGRDTFDCYETSWVYDTIFVRLIEPQNQPPVISSDLSGLPVQGGQVTVEPDTEPYCYTVILEDPDSIYADLVAEGANEIFGEFWRYGNFATLEVIQPGNPLIMQVCWAPSCYDSLSTFELVVCGRDTSRCGLTEEVCDVVTFSVLGCDFDVQNVFSPNDDGINDVFIPYNQQGVDFYNFQVYDRWGVLVHQSEDGQWDGTFKNQGKKVPEGVYFYTIEYQFVSARGIPLREQKVGTVTVLR